MIVGFASAGASGLTNKTMAAGAGSYGLTGTAATLTKTTAGGAVARSGMLPGVAVNTSTTSRTANAAGVMVNG